MRQETSPLTAKQQRAALLVAEDDRTDEEIALEVGIHRATLDRWKHDEDFKAAVHAHIVRLQAELERFSIARKDKRVAALQRRWDAMHGIIEARSDSGSVPHREGGDSGLVAIEVMDGRIVYRFDSSLASSMLALEKQAAVEVGQWTEKKDLTSGGESLTRLYVGVPVDDV